MFKLPSSYMPVLDHLKRVFQAEFGEDFAKLPNRENTLIVIVQHGFLTIRPMMEFFLELGIPSDHVFMTTKPHTTSPETLAYFQETFKEHYVPFAWSESLSSGVQRSAEPSRYKRLTAETHRQLFEKFCDYLFRYPAPAHIQNIIVCDEGGKFLNEFIARYHAPDSRYTKKLSDYHIVAIGHTKCDTYSEALSRLPFPFIPMGDSYLKTKIESEFIAKSMFVNLKTILSRIMKESPVVIGVVGGGNIGREVLDFLLNEYPAVSILIYDREASVFSASKIAEKGWSTVSRAESPRQLFQQANIILGCTGRDITRDLSRDMLKENAAHHLHLISCSSGDVEFQTWLQAMPDYRFESLADVRNWTIPLNFSGDRQLTIYNGGFPMNFLVEQPAGIPAPESVPMQEVQITRGMKLAALVQALKLLEVTPYIARQHDGALMGYMQLDVLYQWEIIQALYRDLMQDASPERQAIIQRKYATITKAEIAQGSVGAPQPTIGSVLKIPHYVTTNYQVRMQKQLASQKTPIKILMIHGTAGSGKTTLGQHGLHQQQIQHSEHLSRTLLAETNEQWRSSLRDWAEALFPELNALLKTEQDPKKQERIVDQHLQQALKKTTWCVLIDNWDQKQLHIGEIERLFLNQEGSVGNGTLIITTQGQSPYGEINSLDLSQGFAPEESQKLFIKVMNLEEELGITWEALGNETELQSLTAFLNHLPLATILAGGYLLWENKSRRKNGESVFTYADYQAMLNQKVTELIQAHDEKLGDKGRMPREEREEFIRLKTQEAAVDLSLRKAIQTESTDPNMNLWQMLCFCGFLASDGIPQQLLKDYIEQILPEDEREIHEAFFEMLLIEAQKYSLLQFESRLSAVDSLRSLHMHRVIQKVLRDRYWQQLLDKSDSFLFIADNQASFLKTAKELKIASQEHLIYWAMEHSLLQRFSFSVKSQSFSVIREYNPHSEMLLLYRLQKISIAQEESVDIIIFQDTLAKAQLLLGKYLKAKMLYQEVLNRSIQFYKTKACLEVVQAQRNLGECLLRLGQYSEAKSLYQEGLTTATQQKGISASLEAAEIQIGLAMTSKKQGRYVEAEALYRQALATKIQYFGTEECESVAQTQQNLANTLEMMGRYEEAATLHRKALVAKIQHYGTKDHIEVAITQQNLANALESLGALKEAEALYREALKTTISHYDSEEQIEVAMIQNNLAIVLTGLKSYPEAEKFCRTALKTKICYYGSETHFEVAGTQQNLAVILDDLGRYYEAEALYRAVLVAKIQHYGTEDQVEIADIQNNLANTLSHSERHQEAEVFSQKALATKIRHYGPAHIEVAKTQLNLALIQMKLEKFSAALKLIYECEYTFKSQMNTALYLENCRKVKESIMMLQNLSSMFSGLGQASENQGLNLYDRSHDHEFAQMIRRAAAEGQCDRLVILLNDHPELINETDTNSRRGWTAFHWAIYKSQYFCIIELLNRNARYNIPDKTTEARTAIDIALEKSNPEISQQLTKYIIKKYIKTNDYEAEKALRTVSGKNDLPAVKWLVAQGVNIDAAGAESGKTALHHAVQKKHHAIAKFLITSGANAEIEDSSGKSAIDYAEGDEQLMDFILNDILDACSVRESPRK